jgi:pSer/pThr/pTyr-binding forkhead associated (FHA) protein
VSEAQLSVLNYALLALIYLFFARVLWAVWSEVRGPRLNPQAAARSAAPTDNTAPNNRPAAAATPVRGKRGNPSKLVVLEPKVRKGAAYPIRTELTLGRADTCMIGLPDDTFASQLHARVYLREGAIWVEDLGSTNGTHLNGAKLTAPVQLSTGDRLQVGSTIFEAQ